MAKANKTAQGPNKALFIVAGGVALAIVLFLVMGSGGGGTGATAPVDLAGGPAEAQQAQGMEMGEDSAPVQLIEFADYQCPACAQFATFAHPLIYDRLVNQGIIKFVRYDFPIVTGHPHAFLASRAARCAGEQDKYWEYHDVLYGRQPTWSSQRGAPTDYFVDYAEELGMDAGAFGQCLRSDKYADEVTRNLRLGESMGVTGTPTLMLNGELIRVRDYNELEQRVMEAAGMPSAPAEESAAPAAQPQI